MLKVIERRSLNLKFENKYLSNFKCYGLLLHDYKPCNDECDEVYEMLTGLRISGDKIECIYHECNLDYYGITHDVS